MDCFHDFCLACDNASTGPYCSQACRLADMEKAHASAPSPPTSPSVSPRSSRLSWQSASSTSSSSATHILPPAYHFGGSRLGTPHATLPSSEEWGAPATSYFARWATAPPQPADHAATWPKVLTTSPSRASLSSTASDGSDVSPGGLSHQACTELQDYFHSFDHAKASKRRPSLK